MNGNIKKTGGKKTTKKRKECFKKITPKLARAIQKATQENNREQIEVLSVKKTQEQSNLQLQKEYQHKTQRCEFDTKEIR